MKSTSKTHASRAFAALLALSVCTGIAQAANTTLLNPASTVAVTCDTHSGSTAATIVVHATTAPTGTNTMAVGVLTSSIPSGLSVVAPSPSVLSATTNTAGLTFTVNANFPGCAGYTSGTAMTKFSFTATPSTTATPGTVTTTDNGTTPTVTVTNTTSGLTGVPTTSIALTCIATTVSGTSTVTYAPGPAVSVPIASASPLGTPFTVDQSTGTGTALPAWLTVTPASGTATSSTAVSLSLVAPANCGGQTTAVTTPVTVSLANLPGPEKTFGVTLTMRSVSIPVSPLAVPNPVSLTYVKGSGNFVQVGMSVTALNPATPPPFFTVDLTTVPGWLTMSPKSGNTPTTINFSPTSICDSLAPGTYTATVGLNVSGSAPQQATVYLLITNTAPKLTISGGTSQALTWTIGAAYPTAIITAISTDSPIPYTVTTAGALQPTVTTAELTGLAYSFGTPIAVSFSPLLFASAQPGSILSGTVSLTWGSPSVTTVVTLNYTVLPPSASAISLNPATLPTNGTAYTAYTVGLIGTGFVVSNDVTQQTQVGFASSASPGAALTPDSYLTWSVKDANHITLTIKVPSGTDNNLKFSPTGGGGTSYIGVCNPNGSTCSVATSAPVALSIGNGPIIQAVSSASTFAQVTAPPQTVAPYDMLSIFGNNFCSAGGSGCTTSTILTAAPAALTLTYPTSLSAANDNTGADTNPGALSVVFWPHTSGTYPTTQPTSGTPTAVAPILFATNNQINVLAPSKLIAGNSYDMYVVFGTLSSASYQVNVIPTNPGIFTVGKDGQGDAAAFSNATLVNTTTPAGVRLSVTNGTVTNYSDTVALYVTGLGVPDSTGDNLTTDTTLATYPGNCSSIAGFLSALNTAAQLSGNNALTTLDGTVIQSALLSTYSVSSVNYTFYPPCVGTNTVYTATVGGVNAPVTYSGWVADSVAGLYQLNIQLPPSISALTDASGNTLASSTTALAGPAELPVVITATTAGSPAIVKRSQTGVTLAVTPRLRVVAPSLLSGTVGQPWCDPSCISGQTSSVQASLSPATTPAYTYAVTSGLLPTGLVLNGATGAITGEAGANTSGSKTITVTATDNSPHPLTGSVTFTVTVAGGLYLVSSGTAPYMSTFGQTTNLTLTTVTATGGAYPYFYRISLPGTIPTGMSINASTGALSVSSTTPSGQYSVQVTAVDQNGVMGNLTFTVNVGLSMVIGTPGSPSLGVGATSPVVSNTTTGQTNTLSCSTAISAGPLGYTGNFAFDSNNNVTLGTVSATGSYTFKVTCTDTGTEQNVVSGTLAAVTSAAITVVVGS